VRTFYGQKRNNNSNSNGFNPYTNINCEGEVNQEDLDIALAIFGQKSLWLNNTTNTNIVNEMLCSEIEHFFIFRGS